MLMGESTRLTRNQRRWLGRQPILLLVALLVLTHSPGIIEARQEPAGATEIRRLLEEQVAAWNHRDLEGFMAGYWRSPNLTFFSNTTMTSGWEQTLERYRKRYQGEGREMGTLRFLDLKIELLGPKAAFVRGRYLLKMTKDESGGIFTLTLRKFGDGWKIIHDHTSSGS
jgi:ketosteroid isomerase-like protein